MDIDLERELIPPPELVRDGSSSLAGYLDTGSHFRSLFEKYLPLHPDMKVLEIGSATGRISRQFVSLLSEKGSYTGIEIMPAQVEWCQREISSRFPSFRFLRADVYNAEYNPGGRVKAEKYEFPFTRNEVDLVVLTSVFTHMLPRDVAHYLMEVARVLKVGGFCFATFFAYCRDEWTRIFTAEANPRFLFPVYKHGGLPLVICANDESLEEAVAYESNFIARMYTQAGLTLPRALPGNWLKRGEWCPSYQDLRIAEKHGE